MGTGTRARIRTYQVTYVQNNNLSCLQALNKEIDIVAITRVMQSSRKKPVRL